MDQSRNRTTKEKILLPTLFEYKNGRRLEDWSSDKRIWLNFIDVTEADNTGKSFSTLPDLSARLRSTDVTKSGEDFNGNNTLEMSRESGDDEFVKNGVIIVDDDEGFSSDKDRSTSATDSEQRGENPAGNEEGSGKKYQEMNIKQNGHRQVKNPANLGTSGIDRGDKVEKMDSVRQWVKNQSFVNPDLNSIEQINMDEEKLPEMDIKMKKYRSKSLQTKLDCHDLLMINHGLKQTSRNMPSELSSRLLETRQRRASAVLTTEGFSLQTSDKDGMKVNMYESDGVKIMPMIGGSQRRFTRRSSTPLPISQAFHSQYLQEGNSTNLEVPICAKTSKSLLKSINMHSSNSNVSSWPLLSCGSRSVTGTASPLRRRSLTPRPPPIIVRPATGDTLRLCP